jgi:peptide/nickel transport system substrate-binding protein
VVAALPVVLLWPAGDPELCAGRRRRQNEEKPTEVFFQTSIRSSARLAAFVVAIAIAGCNGISSESNRGGRHPWTVPGVFRFGAGTDPTSLNPMLDGGSIHLSMFVFSWAVRDDDKAHPFPDALREIPTVANGDVSKDGLTLRYKLRRNIKWQDGPPLTCNDLKFTWKVVMNPHNDALTTDGYKDIRSIDCVNSYLAVVRMKRIYAPFLQQLWSPNGYAPILPEHILAKYNDDKGSFNSAPYNSLPIGSGAFKVVAWDREQDIRMVANPHFYFGKPKLNAVIFKIQPGTNGLGDASVQTHTVDMVMGSQMDWPMFAALASDPENGIVAKPVDLFAWSHVDFNLTRPIVGDRNVRIALAYASNRQELLKPFHGLPIPTETDQNPRLSWAYSNHIRHYPFDRTKARTILDLDGWKVGPDGVRIKKGRRLEFSLSTRSEGRGETVMQLILQREWRDVGVQADIKNYPSKLFFDAAPDGILQGGHYDAAIASTSGSADPDDSALLSGDDLAPRGENTTRWNNRSATAAMNDAVRTVDWARRKRDYGIVQQQLMLDVPMIVTNFIREPFVYNKDLRGFDPSPTSAVFWDPWNYSI